MERAEDAGRTRTGQGLVEYALVILLIAIACFSALGFFGNALKGLYAYINGHF